MSYGTLDIVVLHASLENTSFTSNRTHLYVSARSDSTTKETSVSSDNGCNPSWGENLQFTILPGIDKVTVKVINHETGDDLGHTAITLESVIDDEDEGASEKAHCLYKDGEFRGTLTLGVTYTPHLQHEVV